MCAAALLAAPAILAFDTGGRSPQSQAAAAIGLFALLAVAAALAPWPLAERSWPLAALAALVAFCGWTALSALWSPAVGDAVDDIDRVAVYVAAFALAVIVMRVPGVRRLAPDALLWGVVVVMLYALAGRLLPDVVHVESDSFAGDRLHQPIGYWNATGILAGFGALLATAIAGDDERPLAYRAAVCAAAVPCALACYLTLSRGAWAAVAAGLVVCLLVRPRVASVVAAGLWLVAGGALAGASHAYEGTGLMATTVLLAVAAGVAFGRLVSGGGDLEALVPRSTRARGAVCVVPIVLAAAFAVSFASERTEDIPKSAERVTTLKTFRGDYWRVALDSFADHPLGGVGAASFQVEWVRERDTRQFAFDAHSLYVETLAELGLVGFVLLGTLFAAVAGGLRRRWRAGPADPLLAAAAAVLAAYAVHAGVDWDWEVPAVTLPPLLLAAAVLQRP